MPIQKLLQDRVFEPEVIEVMTGAYECALATLGIKDRTDPITKHIAEKILAIVEGGLRDRHKVYEETVAAFRK